MSKQKFMSPTQYTQFMRDEYLNRNKNNMEKQVKMSLEVAQRFYKECKTNGWIGLIDWLLENWTKEQLEVTRRTPKDLLKIAHIEAYHTNDSVNYMNALKCIYNLAIEDAAISAKAGIFENGSIEVFKETITNLTIK